MHSGSLCRSNDRAEVGGIFDPIQHQHEWRLVARVGRSQHILHADQGPGRPQRHDALMGGAQQGVQTALIHELHGDVLPSGFLQDLADRATARGATDQNLAQRTPRPQRFQHGAPASNRVAFNAGVARLGARRHLR